MEQKNTKSTIGIEQLLLYDAYQFSYPNSPILDKSTFTSMVFSAVYPENSRPKTKTQQKEDGGGNPRDRRILPKASDLKVIYPLFESNLPSEAKIKAALPGGRVHIFPNLRLKPHVKDWSDIITNPKALQEFLRITVKRLSHSIEKQREETQQLLSQKHPKKKVKYILIYLILENWKMVIDICQ